MILLVNLMAVMIIAGTFIYALSFARWLLKRKLYRGAIGVFIMGTLEVTLSLYTLFRQSFE